MTGVAYDLVVWDFDGVLNRNLPQETYVWASSIASDRGLDPVSFEEFRDNFAKLRTLQAQVAFYRALKRLMSVWRVLHVVLAVCLVVMISAHIGLSLFLGYKWIFS